MAFTAVRVRAEPVPDITGMSFYKHTDLQAGYSAVRVFDTGTSS
jgi:hypothetical protein